MKDKQNNQKIFNLDKEKKSYHEIISRLQNNIITLEKNKNEIIKKLQKEKELFQSAKDYKCHCNNDNIKDAYKKTKKEIIEQFTNQNNNNVNDYIKKINDLEMKDKQNNQRINNLEKETYNQQGIIFQLTNQNNSLNQQLNSLQKQKSEKENEIIILEKNIEKLEKEKNILQLAINGDFNSIDRLRKLGIEVNYKGENNMIRINPNNHQIIGRKEESKVDFMNFYDVIIDIKSVKDINKGWEIKMSEKGLQNYRKFHEDKIIKIGVIGNSNKGKSFLLSKISKIKLPSGTSIRTEGLSVKYPELELFEDRKIALLDSAGLETPVLKNSEDKNSKLTVKELFKEKSREKLITELFLQNYIINISDILITVVGILTYSEQKLLNRIKTEFQRAKIKKPLFIIHNLVTYTTVAQIEEYIKEYLLQSSTFDLEKGHGVNTKTKNEKETGVYYLRKTARIKYII